MRRVWLLPVLSLLASCDFGAGVGPAAPAARRPLYYDVKGFLDAEVKTLLAERATAEKKVTLRDGQTETVKVAPVAWDKELQLFYQADINKPALRGSYELGNQSRPETPWFYWQRKADVDAPVERLTVVPSGADTLRGPIELLTAVIKQDNPLYYAQKTLTLHARQGRIYAYEVKGVQKLVLFDSVRYSVSTRVLR
ncbi:hypothetical protein LJY25_04165 [Hymenobacter sp. BT175]|uniref:hypothetical protein n=1 Tax=Hymenobacter translucens TaxID=2886507 RepID=UPI001D0E24E0|nr:hypothetical protein [Hymenobacter translucens]MCC2545628.1 hypothetical protein [Hymenobacter translucens]